MWPVRKLPIMRRSQACLFRCWRLVCQLQQQPQSCLRPLSNIIFSQDRCYSLVHSTLVWGLIASLYIGNVMLLVLNLPLVGLWVRLLSIPQPLLYGGILVFSTLGVYSPEQFDL